MADLFQNDHLVNNFSSVAVIESCKKNLTFLWLAKFRMILNDHGCYWFDDMLITWGVSKKNSSITLSMKYMKLSEQNEINRYCPNLQGKLINSAQFTCRFICLPITSIHLLLHQIKHWVIGLRLS